ncbi:hypothetical protein [Parachitinimonas caeni]|uniref:Uncharacterized protein n=1 Tax=Parachitinimonas caeni TaxID=3031301 RepID=A0ABT7E6R3_9NEIS|nr:hypothetical protein [Parachitinimonas caeni]MDK2127043.1 hypothetical protein [Parachitinimonas caeni]
MLVWEMVFSETCNFDKFCYVGGGAPLNKESWPCNKRGEALIHLATISSFALKRFCGISIDEQVVVSIFSSYLKSDYFLDEITYSGSEQELEEIRSGSTKVVVCGRIEEENNFSEFYIPKRYFNCVEQIIENDCIPMFSFLAESCPNFTQNEIMKFDGMRFISQFYSGDFPKPFRGVLGMVDAVGYAFLDISGSNSNGGLFFVQTG